MIIKEQYSIFDVPGVDQEHKSFHNTNGIEGEDLLNAEASAEGTEAKVRDFFASQPLAKFAAFEVFNALVKTHKKILLSSVKRSCSDLKFAKKLIQTDDKVKSKHGGICKRYQWNPSQPVTQADHVTN